MTMTAAIKGQITKATNAARKADNPQIAHQTVCRVFARHMPRQQAKHAARKVLRSL